MVRERTGRMQKQEDADACLEKVGQVGEGVSQPHWMQVPPSAKRYHNRINGGGAEAQKMAQGDKQLGYIPVYPILWVQRRGSRKRKRSGEEERNSEEEVGVKVVMMVVVEVKVRRGG